MISLTTKPIGFAILGKLNIGRVIVLGYFIFSFRTWDGLSYFSSLRISSLLPRKIMSMSIVSKTFYWH